MSVMRWLLLMLVAAVQIAAAQSYPTKPVRLLVPYPPGGPVDNVGRILAQPLSPILGQNVIVENRSGGGGSVGADAAAKATPDGYTLLLGNSGPMTINPVLQQALPYDPRKDFAPVTWLDVRADGPRRASVTARALGEGTCRAGAAPIPAASTTVRPASVT